MRGASPYFSNERPIIKYGVPGTPEPRNPDYIMVVGLGADGQQYVSAGNFTFGSTGPKHGMSGSSASVYTRKSVALTTQFSRGHNQRTFEVDNWIWVKMRARASAGKK
jgi:hypothetical protein